MRLFFRVSWRSHAIRRHVLRFVVGVTLICFIQFLPAQQKTAETGRASVFDVDMTQLPRTNEQITPQQQFLEQAFETEIDSTQYILGPGDQLLIKIWGALDQQFTTPVTPEGYVIIPSVTEIFVSGKTLAAGASSIKSDLGKVFKNASFSVRLAKMRKFRVFVVGEVQAPGSYYFRAVDRLSDAIQLSYGLSGWADDTRIQVRHLSGAVDTVNISEFFVTGDLNYNPFVQGGDIIFVPPIDLERDYAILEGNVGSQGVYQIHPGETLFQFLTRLRTINRQSDIENIVLIRGAEKKVYNLLASEIGPQREVLQNGDRIIIPTTRDQVYVRGEVGRPGPLPYLANYTATDYAGLAGILDTAKEMKDVYVIRTKTGKIEKGKDMVVNSGDIVVVPRRGRETVKEYLAILTPVVGIVISTIALVQSSK